jgi:glutamyl-tRNA reductase
MLKIIDIGMNHETAPVELRECLAATDDDVSRVLNHIKEVKHTNEGMFLSTCNRVEAILVTKDAAASTNTMLRFMADQSKIAEEQLRGSLYILEDVHAVQHIFRVTSSLDSMVVGEPQILGQIKEAYFLATKHKTSGVILNRLMHRAFHVAKRVRTETGISAAAVSISYAAVELARKIFEDLEDKKVLLIGTGEMAELAVKHIMGQGACHVSVANRTLERAVQLANLFNAEAVSFDEIPAELEKVDIVLTSTAASDPIITYEMVKDCSKRRRNRPLFFVDIAVPRDVEPQVNAIDNVYVYDIDDLKGVIEINMAQRQQEAVKAERIVQEEVLKFDKWLKTLSVVPTIISMQEKADAIIQAELKRSETMLSKMNETQREALLTLVRSVTEKVLNDPILFLKKKADTEAINTYLDFTKKLFGLDQEDKGPG